VPATVLLFLALAAPAFAAPGSEAFHEQSVWALNVGGGALETRAGDRFDADRCDDTSRTGRCVQVSPVWRTQAPALYGSFRSGDQRYRVDLPDGGYDVLLYFTEPAGTAGASRLLDVFIQGQRLLTNFRIPESAGGEPHMAMSRGFIGIEVSDGTLDITVEGRRGDAVLSGIQVRSSRFSTDGWELVWSDDFSDAKGLYEQWTAEQWEPGHVNDEEQAYRRSPDNVRVEDGVLILEAHPTGEVSPAFTSGRVHSWGHRAFRYGRLDIRARVPEGRGVWPALWLLPDDPYRYATNCASDEREWQGSDDCDAWPNSGEIDLMEHIGYEPGVVHGTVHTRDFYAGHGNQVQASIVVPGLGQAFQTYSLVWEEGAMAMYVDGVRYYSYFDAGQGSGQWPFDHPFHIVMNLAVGGAWGAALGPVETAAFPRRLEIDFVRLYERQAAVGAR